jgi:hypothetical protein
MLKHILLQKITLNGEELTGVFGSKTATVVVNATDVYFENITFENTWGYEK